MRLHPLSIGAGTARRASAAVLCSALVAACDTDRTVAPNTPSAPAEVPTAASAAVIPSYTGSLVIKTVSVYNHPIGPAKFKILGPNLVVSYITDNDGNDADATLGKIWLKSVAVGNYNICEIVAPPTFALPDWACHPSSVMSGSTTGVEAFVHNYLPSVAAGYLDHLGALIGGGALTVKDSTGTPVMLIADNGALDVSKKDGVFAFFLPSAGKFSVCGLTTPPGYALSPEITPCHPVNAKYNIGNNVPAFRVNPAPSAMWSVKDAFGVLVGPSSFSVSIPGVFLFNVVDNNTNDLDPTLGRVLAKFPAPGPYTLCQTQAPPNRWVAQPPCRTVNILAGASVNAGVFTNYEAQVPSQ